LVLPDPGTPPQPDLPIKPAGPLTLDGLPDQEYPELKINLKKAIEGNPDTHSKVVDLSKRSGLPEPVVERNLEEVNANVKSKQALSTLEAAPVLKDRITKDSSFARANSDNIESLKDLEGAAVDSVLGFMDAWKYVRESLNTAAVGLGSSLMDLPGAMGRIIDSAVQTRTGPFKGLPAGAETDVHGAVTEGIGGYGPAQASDWLDKVNEQMADPVDAQFRQEAHQFTNEAFDKALEGDFEDMGTVLTDPKMLAGFVAEAVPSLAVMALTGASWNVIAAMEAGEVASEAEEYEKRTGIKIDPTDFTMAMAQAVPLNTLFERISFKFLAGANSFTDALLSPIAEMTTEGLQAFNTNVAIRLKELWGINLGGFDPNKSLTEGVVPGMIGGFGAGAGAGTTGAISSTTAPDSPQSQDLIRAHNAEKSFRDMDTLIEKYEAVNTEGRDLSLIKDHLDNLLGAENEVYIDYRDAEAFFQSEIMEALPEELAAEIRESLDSETDVAIAKSDYIVHLNEHHDQLKNVIRNDMDGMTYPESQTWAEDYNEETLRRAEEVLQKYERDSEFTQEVTELETTFREQQIAAGFEPKVASATASLFKNFIAVAADKENLTPKALIEKYPQLGLQVQGAPIAAVEEQVFTGKLSTINEYGASIGRLSEGTKRQLMEDPDGGYFWGDYGEAIDLAGEGYELAGEHKDFTPATFLSSKEAKAAAAETPQSKRAPGQTVDLLAQGPISDAMAQYRTEQEARPIKDFVATPITNKDGTYRKNATGDITGAPKGVKTKAQVDEIVENNVGFIESDLAQMPSSAQWYEVSGAAIRAVTQGDPVKTEQMIRMMAVLSATNQVGGNVTGAIKAIYQLSRGEVAAAGRFPNKFAQISQQILDAKDMSLAVPGVDSKVMSFYQNLWDATFLSEKYEHAATMDMWMARLYGYDLDTFGAAQYRFANMVTQQITEQYNAKHDTNLKPRQIQAALWVYARNRERFGGQIGSAVALQDRSGFDTYIERAKQNITVEAAPSMDSGLFPEIHQATPEQKAEYTRQAMQLLLNEQGENELFNQLGIPLYTQQPSEGTFEGAVSPNEILSIVSEKVKGKPDTTKADLAARALQYIYTQDGVPWFQLDPTATGATRGVAINMTAQPSVEMEEAFLTHLNETVDADFTRVGNDFFLLNFTDLPNKKFIAAVVDAAESYEGPGVELIEEIETDVKAKSNYLAQDWSDEQKAVAEIEGEFSDAGQQDLLGWLRDRREAVARLQADFRDQNLGALYQGPGLAPFDLAFEHEIVTPDQLKGYEEAHAADRAAKALGQVVRGQLDPRRPPSVRREADGSYTVLDGRSGVTAAINAGYEQIPVRVIDSVLDDKGNVIEVSPEVEEMMHKSARAKDHFDKAMEQIAQNNESVWIDVKLKGRTRVMEKTASDYGGDPNQMKDMLRGTISTANLGDVGAVLNEITIEHGKRLVKLKTHLMDVKTVMPFEGYQDVMAVIDFEGVKAEIQVNTREFVMAKEVIGHQLYEGYRKEKTINQRVKDFVAVEQKLYRDIYALARKTTPTPEMVFKVIDARRADIEKLNETYGLSMRASNSAKSKFSPLWMAGPGGKFRGGSRGMDLTSNVIDSTSDPSIAQTPELTKLWDQGSLADEVKQLSKMAADAVMRINPDQPMFMAPNNRAQIQFTDQGALITLLENADPSSVIHELSHYFFESYMVMAESKWRRVIARYGPIWTSCWTTSPRRPASSTPSRNGGPCPWRNAARVMRSSPERGRPTSSRARPRIPN
jgi:hypothetical protein